MESNTPQDSATLELQIQTLTTSDEELTEQNREMRLQLQQEENRSPTRIEPTRITMKIATREMTISD